MRECITSSTVMRFWNWAFGLRAPYSCAFTAIIAEGSRRGRAGLVHVAPRPHGVDGRHDIAEIDLHIGRFQRQRAAAEPGQLLDTQHRDCVGAAGLDHQHASRSAAAPLEQAFSTVW